MTLGLPPSMMATQELVVPRSMPMIFAMFVPFVWGMSSSAGKVGFTAGVSSFRPGYNHQRRPDDAVVEEVALLQHRDHGVGLLVAIDLADGLVAVGIEFLAEGRDRLERELLEHRIELARRELHTLLEG